MASKYDIYSKLIEIGAKKYSVIPEYGIYIKLIEKIKLIDLVWACIDENGIYTPKYLFEIEGANMPIDSERGLRRHVRDFSSSEFDKTTNILILYTKGDGVRKWNEKDYSLQIEKRRNWAEENNARFEIWTYEDFNKKLKHELGLTNNNN